MSLRGRLLLALGAAALIALMVADVATYSSLRSFLNTRVDQALETAHVPLERLFSGNRDDLGQSATVSFNTFVEVRTADGTVLFSRPILSREGQPLSPGVPNDLRPVSAAGDAARYATVNAAPPGGPQFRVRISNLPDGTQLIVAEPLEDTVTTLRRLLAIEVAVTIGALVAASALGWWFVRVGLRPLADVERTAEAIADGELDQRVPGESDKTEVGRLARTVNTMLGRIERAFEARDATEAELRRSEERLRQFVADASHELRTPLAAVSAYAELFDRGAREHPEDLERVMTGIRVESSRMAHLVNDLLLLARLDNHLPLDRKPVELVALAAEAVETASAVGPQWPLTLHADQPVEVTGDALRLRQVLDNLLANVRAHTPPGTPGQVVIRHDGTTAIVEVSDRGPGLSPDEAARVFERFYRADPSRSRRHGGTGLGLGIVAAIVAAHGGTVTVSSAPGTGSTFRVELPVAGVSEPDSIGGGELTAAPAPDSPTVAAYGGEDR